jgi:hypothetical protein
MRFPSVAVAPLLFSVYMASTLAIDTTADPNNVVAKEEVSKTVDAAVSVRRFPAIWNVVMDEDFAETPAIMAQMEQALILSANEVHNNADITFLSASTKRSVHERITEDGDDNHKRKKMMMLDGDYEDQVDTDKEQKTVAAAGALDKEETPNLRMNWSINIRPKNSKNNPVFRPNYTTNLSCYCRLCSDDDAVAVTARPLEQGSLFYELKDGQEIRAEWQKRFCQRLRTIPTLEKARHCFIYLDLDHEEPGDGAEDSA